jgi:hypothetical protein
MPSAQVKRPREWLILTIAATIADGSAPSPTPSMSDLSILRRSMGTPQVT